MACAKTIRKRDKVLSRIRRDKEARKRKKQRMSAHNSTKAKPGYWLDTGTADIHAAIVKHLRLVTQKLIKNLVLCRVTGPNQAYRSDLAFRKEFAFIEYSKIAINGDNLMIVAEITPRPRARRNSLYQPIRHNEYKLILSDPELFDKLSEIAGTMADNYFQLVEPNHGT